MNPGAYILLYSFAAVNFIKAQSDSATKNQTSGFLKSTSFCQAFVSDIDNYKPQIEVNYSSNCEEYDLSETKKTFKLFQTIHLGAEIPYFLKISTKNGVPRYGWGINSTISFHMWWDPLETSTSPILNTDYRFESFVFKYIFFLNGNGIKNLSFKLSPFNHESTHLGDELTMYRSRKKYPITRINVSYEYSEMNFTINDPNGSFKRNHSFRMGIKYRINGSQDYYTISSKDGDSTLAFATGLKSEYYAQYNFIRNTGILTSRKWVNIISFEIRNRPLYKYPTFNSHDGIISNCCPQQKRCWGANLYFGYKYVKSGSNTLGLYLHGYCGINPNGQFRNQKCFKSIGLSIVLE